MLRNSSTKKGCASESLCVVLAQVNPLRREFLRTLLAGSGIPMFPLMATQTAAEAAGRGGNQGKGKSGKSGKANANKGGKGNKGEGKKAGKDGGGQPTPEVMVHPIRG